MNVNAWMFAPATDCVLESGLSKSISVATRKMVIYAWGGQSQEKLWWNLVAILLCTSFQYTTQHTAHITPPRQKKKREREREREKEKEKEKERKRKKNFKKRKKKKKKKTKKGLDTHVIFLRGPELSY